MVAQWISRLNESDSRLHKENVLSEALSLAILGNYDSQVFLSLVKATYDPFVTFGIKQVQNTSDLENRENPWTDYNSLLIKLYNRELTGNAARESLNEMSQRFDSFEWNNFCAPVIRKDLRAGISDKTINKVVKNTEYEIPTFGCQLATSCEDRPEMAGKKRIEPKLDGVRVLMLCSIRDDGLRVAASYSRNGKIFENFGHIEKQLMEHMDYLSVKTGFTYFFLDGEVVSNSFQELMRQARRKENAQAQDSVFHIFDIIPGEDFVRGYWNAALNSRLMLLNKIRPIVDKMPNVKLLNHIDVDLDTALGREQFDRYAKDCVSDGFEGVMIKSLNAPYECKRNTFWLKWKPVITVDLEVVDVEEGTGRNLGRLGALVCSGSDHGKQINVNVGSGFSDADRDDFWINRLLVLGRTVEIMADVISKNQDGTYSLRFPRFVRFRDDK